jgi:hypothetical protein
MNVEAWKNISLWELLLDRLNTKDWDKIKIRDQNEVWDFAFLDETQVLLYKQWEAKAMLLKDLFFEWELEELLEEDCNNWRSKQEIIECVLNNLWYQTWDFPQEIHSELARAKDYKDKVNHTKLATREGIKETWVKLWVQ